MIVINDNDSLTVSRAVVAIGKFDGVHLGHSALLRAAEDEASHRRERGEACVWGVITFDAHPAEYLHPGSAPTMLTPLHRKLSLLAEHQPAFCVVLGVQSGILNWPPERFVQEVLVNRVPVVTVLAGDDFRYGKGRRGDLETLRSTGAFDVQVVSPVTLDGRRISSYGVREALYSGDLDMATRMLGRYFDVSGPVVQGRRVGSTLGFPTANMRVSERVVVPRNGVYQVISAWKDDEGYEHSYRGVANIGVRPTMEPGSGVVSIEVHIPGWSGDLYGRTMTATFERRLRAEMRFGSVEELQEQIQRDVDAVKK